MISIFKLIREKVWYGLVWSVLVEVWFGFVASALVELSLVWFD